MKQPGSWYLRAVQVLNEMLNVVDPVSQFHKKGNIAPIKQTVQKDKLQLPRDSSVLSQFLDRVEMFFFHAVFLPARRQKLQKSKNHVLEIPIELVKTLTKRVEWIGSLEKGGERAAGAMKTCIQVSMPRLSPD